LLLAGVGHIDSKQQPNFLVVDASKSLKGSLLISWTMFVLITENIIRGLRNSTGKARRNIHGTHKEERYWNYFN
jgi:hypothetical protein